MKRKPRHRLKTIDCINQSTVVSDSDCLKYVNAIQMQVSTEFADAYGIDAKLNFISSIDAKGGLKPDPKHWWMAILDDSDQAGALGYHDMSNTGLPIGKVFAKTDLQYGSLVSVTLSHEVLEMLDDPWINRVIQLEAQKFCAEEDADAVEADTDGYDKGGVIVSDFVLPEYFQPGSDGPWDYKSLLTGPVPTIRPQGYMSIYTVGQGWSQINGAAIASGSIHARFRARPHAGSRRERRTRPRDQWLVSELK